MVLAAAVAGAAAPTSARHATFVIGASSTQRFTESGCHHPNESSDKVLARQPPVCHPCRTETAVRAEPPGLSPATASFVAASLLCECNKVLISVIKFHSVEVNWLGYAQRVFMPLCAKAAIVAETGRAPVSLQRVLVPLLMDEGSGGSSGFAVK